MNMDAPYCQCQPWLSISNSTFFSFSFFVDVVEYPIHPLLNAFFSPEIKCVISSSNPAHTHPSRISNSVLQACVELCYFQHNEYKHIHIQWLATQCIDQQRQWRRRRRTPTTEATTFTYKWLFFFCLPVWVEYYVGSCVMCVACTMRGDMHVCVYVKHSFCGDVGARVFVAIAAPHQHIANAQSIKLTIL